MNRIKGILGIAAFALLVLALPSAASAQWGGNGGYGNGGYNGGNIRGAVQNLKQQARGFEQMTNRVDDRDDGRYGSNRGWGNNNRNRGGDIGRIENLADDFKKATDKLEKKFGNGRNLNNSRDEAMRVLNIASQIDNEVQRTGNRAVMNQWYQMRGSLDAVASVYGYGYNRNQNRGRDRNNRNGDWRNRMPFPLPF